ncbi:cysteine desulfurase family protein [Robertmurraya sp. DFI.2.37]|uniref:cysteine desulfurase family protein n=1 Tax=Robertmurraya sp. DFI.2.37 TaxID=3031819 RepID=UPI001244633C|nr:cysteine desulfurase family protein [Robertmurraya sp. DFI.2.37]MDF1510649.1 cysteine desulfurase family protein [Robertmurraya sp. DFI.2.37]
MERIYVDHAATAPMHPQVIEVMIKVMSQQYGNPSSIHAYGREARHIVDEARAQLAKSINAHPNEIIMTSGGTEADNYALIGVAEANKDKGNHIITTQIEHHAVLHTCQQLEKKGFEVTYLPVDSTGAISIAELKKALREDTILVSIMYGNNEVGTLQPIKEIGALLSSHGTLFHTDAVQAYGLVDIDVRELHVDLLSVSAHKINGPKGIGFLYIRNDVKVSPLIFGGEQERKRRAGTENVASIAGFQEAVKVAQLERDKKVKEYQHYKEILINTLKIQEIEFSVNGSLENSLPHVLNLSFPGINVEAMLVNLDLAGVAASSGSACTAGSIDPSHVLVAMFGSQSEKLRNSIRFSFGLYNTADQIQKVAETTAEIVKRLTNK